MGALSLALACLAGILLRLARLCTSLPASLHCPQVSAQWRSHFSGVTGHCSRFRKPGPPAGAIVAAPWTWVRRGGSRALCLASSDGDSKYSPSSLAAGFLLQRCHAAAHSETCVQTVLGKVARTNGLFLCFLLGTLNHSVSAFVKNDTQKGEAGSPLNSHFFYSFCKGL